MNETGAIANFAGYIKYVAIDEDEVMLTLHSSDPEVFALLRENFERELECTHDDSAIWFHFEVSARA